MIFKVKFLQEFGSKVIDYFKAEIDKKEIEAVSRVLEGGWVTTGKE